MEKNRIVLFTLHDCIYCTELKCKLKESSVEYINVDITENIELWESVVIQTGDDTLPTVLVIDNDGNGTIYTAGRDFQSNDEMVEILKNIDIL